MVNRNKYIFARDVSKSEWIALQRDYKRGEIVERAGDQFGLCRDDAQLGGMETVCVKASENRDFCFTVPVNMLLDEAGAAVHGDYSVTP